MGCWWWQGPRFANRGHREQATSRRARLLGVARRRSCRSVAVVIVVLFVAVAGDVHAQSDCTTGAAVRDVANSPGLVADCETLLAVRDELAGDGRLNWSADTPMNSWHGVIMSGIPLRVTHLDLSRMRLSGRIPSGLGDLDQLQELVLDENNLSGGIPAKLGNLTNLAKLSLDQNSLSGILPKELGRLTNLTELNIINIDLGGPIPGEFVNLLNLREVSAIWDLFWGCLPASFAGVQGVSSEGITFCNNLPGKPEPPAVEWVSEGNLKVVWYPPVSAVSTVTGYDVEYRAGGGEFLDASYEGAATETTISGLSSDSRYDVRVRATNADGLGPWSESSSALPGVVQTVRFAASSYRAVEGGESVPVVVNLSSVAASALTIRGVELRGAGDGGRRLHVRWSEW